MSKVAEKKENDRGDFPKALLREAFGNEIPLKEAEKIADAVTRFTGRPAKRKRRRYGARCAFVMEDGRKCKQRGWLGGEFCFQHDPEAAELRKLAGRPRKERLTKGQEVEELLEETLHELRAGRMKPGQAYATGYLAQLMLMARDSQQKEVKLDVKWFWEMVDLAIALEDGAKSLKEKQGKAREEKKAKKARGAAAAKARSRDEEREQSEEVEEAEEGDEAEEEADSSPRTPDSGIRGSG